MSIETHLGKHIMIDCPVIPSTVLAGKIFPGSKEDIFSLMGFAGYDHFPHPGSYDQDRRIYKDQVFVRRDVKRRICGRREVGGSKIKNTVCHDDKTV